MPLCRAAHPTCAFPWLRFGPKATDAPYFIGNGIERLVVAFFCCQSFVNESSDIEPENGFIHIRSLPQCFRKVMEHDLNLFVTWKYHDNGQQVPLAILNPVVDPAPTWYPQYS